MQFKITFNILLQIKLVLNVVQHIQKTTMLYDCCKNLYIFDEVAVIKPYVNVYIFIIYKKIKKIKNKKFTFCVVPLVRQTLISFILHIQLLRINCEQYIYIVLCIYINTLDIQTLLAQLSTVLLSVKFWKILGQTLEP